MTKNSGTPEENHRILTTEQEKEIIRRDIAFVLGETGARDWDEIIKELELIIGE